MSVEDCEKIDPMERREPYHEAVRISERILELQVRIMLDRFDRTDRFVRVEIAALAGMVAVIGFFVAGSWGLPPLGVAGIGSSILMVIGSVFFMVRLNAGFHPMQLVQLGPDPNGMVESIDDAGMTQYEFSDYLAHLMPDHVNANIELIQSVSNHQGRAVMLGAAGVLLFLVTILYIVGGHIYA